MEALFTPSLTEDDELEESEKLKDLSSSHLGSVLIESTSSPSEFKRPLFLMLYNFYRL